MERDLLRDIKVGVFVLGTILLGFLAAFLLGGSSDMFEDRYTLHCSFDDVGALRPGAVVRLGGFDVGEVSNIQFSEDLGNTKILVDLSLRRRFSPRIRENSLARVDSEGMLGDKIISVSVGSLQRQIKDKDSGEWKMVESKELADGDWLTTEESVPLVEYQKQANEVLYNIQGISKKVNLALGDDEEANRASVANVVTSVDELLVAAKEGNGLLHALIYDEALTRRLKTTVGNLEQASSEIAQITTEVRTGDGFANALIYGDEGKDLAQQLAALSQSVEGLVADIENEQGLVHALIYDEERATMVADLHETATSLRVISQAIENGEGTAGLLARDPALYEDLRSLVNGAQRNKLLRSYVRRTVEQGEESNAAPWAPVDE